jgi:hypothetical protein
MALGIFKKAWNTTQLADLTSYFANYLTTVLTSYASIAYVTNALTGYIRKLNTADTATGVDDVTINALSGIIEYSEVIAGNSYHAFTFTNSRVDEFSVLFLSIKSPSAATGGSGLPYIQSYSTSSTTVTVVIANSDINATAAPFFLNFLIVS